MSARTNPAGTRIMCLLSQPSHGHGQDRHDNHELARARPSAVELPVHQRPSPFAPTLPIGRYRSARGRRARALVAHQWLTTQVRPVTRDERRASDLWKRWSGWPLLNRRPLRPELAAVLGVRPRPQLDPCVAGSSCWRLRGGVAVLLCCTASADDPLLAKIVRSAR
jgi:hypothetical protein